MTLKNDKLDKVMLELGTVWKHLNNDIAKDAMQNVKKYLAELDNEILMGTTKVNQLGDFRVSPKSHTPEQEAAAMRTHNVGSTQLEQKVVDVAEIPVTGNMKLLAITFKAEDFGDESTTLVNIKTGKPSDMMNAIQKAVKSKNIINIKSI